jgi:hypothetical protein
LWPRSMAALELRRRQLRQKLRQERAEARTPGVAALLSMMPDGCNGAEALVRLRI